MRASEIPLRALKTAFSTNWFHCPSRSALPSLRAGTYSVRAIPRTGKRGDPLRVVVESGSTKRTFNVTAPTSGSFEIAEFELR